MQRIDINRMDGLSAYKLSHLVSNLVFVRPNLRGQLRPDKIKKAVLRALCDRYPNVWPSVADIAAKVSCSVSQAQRVLRELEFKDRMIVDISHQGRVADAVAVVRRAREAGSKVPLVADVLSGQGKKGGRGKGCTVQYFVLDRKIFDIVQQQRYWAEWGRTRSSEESVDASILGHVSVDTRSDETNTRSSENQYSVI
jgi:hypothetical protein